MNSNVKNFFEGLSVDLIHIAQSYASDNRSPQIEPAHIFRALLHKSVGLVHFIEDTLDEDYYYLVDWCDIHIQQCERSPYTMRKAEFSAAGQSVIKEACSLEQNAGTDSCKLELLLAALVSPGVGFTSEQLKTMPLTKEKILSAINTGGTISGNHNERSATTLRNTGNNVYGSYMLDSVSDVEIIGMERELRALTEILARRDRANVLIIGESGVGKTSLIHGLINMQKEGRLPSSLSQIKPFEIDLISLSQGVSYKGEVEDRFKTVVDCLCNEEQPVLVIENFHRLGETASILSAIMPAVKKILSTNALQLICTTSVDGYTKCIEKDKELTAYFENISLEASSEEFAVSILKSKQNTYEQYHHLTLGNDVISEVVRLAKRYMPERNLPSSAIDLLDRSMASVKVRNELESSEEKTAAASITLEKEDIRNIVSGMTGIPMGNIQSEERRKLSEAEAILHKRVVGQNHAIKSILDAVFESRSGLNKKGQPIGSFFFLGPTGTGKTELAKSLAEFLFNDETSILRFDMSEYKEEHSVALLYGAPPGYVGYEEGGLLVNQIRQHPYSVVLFDEIEKAHRSVFDLFLQILDEGKLHDRLGRVGDFSNALIIFTSNIGSDFIFKSFGEGIIPTHDRMLEVMQGQFRPEFLARLTEIVPFSPITSEMIERIFDIHIQNLLKTLAEQNISLNIDDSAREYITKVGFNAHYGARPILGIIRKEIRRPLSKLIISGDVNSGDTVTMKYNKDSKEIIWDIDCPE